VLNTNARVVLKEIDAAEAGAPAAPDASPAGGAGPAKEAAMPATDRFAAYYDDPAVANVVRNFRGRIVGVRGNPECQEDQEI
jgi:hypothetical protein